MALDQWPMQTHIVMGADAPCWACREVRWAHTHACTHVYTLTLTLGLLVYIVEIWSSAINWSRWKEEKPKRAAEEAVNGKLCPCFLNAVFANCVDHGLKSMSQLSCLVWNTFYGCSSCVWGNSYLPVSQACCEADRGNTKYFELLGENSPGKCQVSPLYCGHETLTSINQSPGELGIKGEKSKLYQSQSRQWCSLLQY